MKSDIFFFVSTVVLVVLGIMFLWLMIYLKNSPLPFGKKLLHTCGFLLVVMVPHTFYQEVSYLAHFWGIMGGFLVGLAYPRKVSLATIST